MGRAAAQPGDPMMVLTRLKTARKFVNCVGNPVYARRGIWGRRVKLRRPRVLTRDSPAMIAMVDPKENIERLMPQPERIADSGLVVSSSVPVSGMGRGAPADAQKTTSESRVLGRVALGRYDAGYKAVRLEKHTISAFFLAERFHTDVQFSAEARLWIATSW
jgi:PII-like signaling protein